ncbi:hypothetical protein [Pseudoalteromonas xiamenensis]|nr:hypothetical protein [Pseudoalteromonas xiamenensis]
MIEDAPLRLLTHQISGDQAGVVQSHLNTMATIVIFALLDYYTRL